MIRTLVTTNIANSRVVLLRAAREIAHEERHTSLREAANRLSWIGLDATRAASIDEARGHEGLTAQTYFAVFDAMIVGDREALVFECLVDSAQWVAFRATLVAECNPEQDSLRFYFLGNKWKRRVEHIGAKVAYDPQGPLLI